MARARRFGDCPAVNPDAKVEVDRRPISVLLSDVRSMVARMIRNALEDAGMLVIERRFDRESAPLESGWEPDVVIVSGKSAGVPPRYHDLVRRHPHLKLLAVTAAADRADLYELRLLGTNVGYQGVVTAVRSVVAQNVQKEN